MARASGPDRLNPLIRNGFGPRGREGHRTSVPRGGHGPGPPFRGRDALAGRRPSLFGGGRLRDLALGLLPYLPQPAVEGASGKAQKPSGLALVVVDRL